MTEAMFDMHVRLMFLELVRTVAGAVALGGIALWIGYLVGRYL